MLDRGARDRVAVERLDIIRRIRGEAGLGIAQLDHVAEPVAVAMLREMQFLLRRIEHRLRLANGAHRRLPVQERSRDLQHNLLMQLFDLMLDDLLIELRLRDLMRGPEA